MKRDIENRQDLDRLVRTFYLKVREEELLGPIFNTIIPNETAWEKHFGTLTDFWETNLFFRKRYKGNPLKAHREVDHQVNNSITQEHFGRWLNLWYATLDELFEGEKADQAKYRARNMSTFMFIKIFEARPKVNS